MRAGPLRSAPLAGLVSAHHAVHAGPCSVIGVASAWRKKLQTHKCGSAYPNCATCSRGCCGADGTALSTCCIGPSGEDDINSELYAATIESADRLCPPSIYNCSTKPKITDYPVYDDQSVFTGDYYSVESFATWQTKRTVDCPYPPCLNDLQRPDPRLGTINSFESAASSDYNGLTLLVKGKIGKQLFIRVGYTFAKALDDGPDSLVVERPGNVQNAYATQLERGLSVTDQRNRIVASSVYEPASFHYEQPVLNALFNNWK